MSLELTEFENLPVYKDGRVFDWQDENVCMTFGDYTITNKYGYIWEAFKITEAESKRLAIGTKDFCMKSVEHQIRQDELA